MPRELSATVRAASWALLPIWLIIPKVRISVTPIAAMADVIAESVGHPVVGAIAEIW